MRIVATLAAAILCQLPAVAVGAVVQSEAAPADVTARNVAQFQFFRARYFHDLMVAEGCPGSFPERFKLLDDRYDAARRALAARYGASYFDVTKPVDTNGKPPCFDGTFLGFEDKIVGLEKMLAQGK